MAISAGSGARPGVAGSDFFEVRGPADGQVVGRLPVHTPERMAEMAVREYCRNQAFVSERIALPGELNWYPYKPARSRLMGRMIRLLGLHDWRRRLGRRPR